MQSGRMVLRGCVLLGLLAFTATGVGCKQSLKTFNLTLELNDQAIDRGRATEVDVVAVSEAEAERLRSLDVSNAYFLTGAPYRQSLLNSGDVWSVVLSPENPSAELSASDPIWRNQWKNDEHLFILADILGVSAQNGIDARRLEKSRAWLWDKNVTATVGTARISLDPEPEKPE